MTASCSEYIKSKRVPVHICNSKQDFSSKRYVKTQPLVALQDRPVVRNQSIGYVTQSGKASSKQSLNRFSFSELTYMIWRPFN